MTCHLLKQSRPSRTDLKIATGRIFSHFSLASVRTLPLVRWLPTVGSFLDTTEITQGRSPTIAPSTLYGCNCIKTNCHQSLHGRLPSDTEWFTSQESKQADNNQVRGVLSIFVGAELPFSCKCGHRLDRLSITTRVSALQNTINRTHFKLDLRSLV